MVTDPDDELDRVALRIASRVVPERLLTGDRAGRGGPALTQDGATAKAETLTMLATASVRQGNMDDARRCFLDALEAARASGVERAIDGALHNVGTFLSQTGDADGAAHHYEQSLEISRRRGDRHNQALTLSNLGGLATLTGKSGTALEYLREAQDAIDGLGDRHTEAVVLTEFGNALLRRRRLRGRRRTRGPKHCAARHRDQRPGIDGRHDLWSRDGGGRHRAGRGRPPVATRGRMAEEIGLVEVIAGADMALANLQLVAGSDPAAAARLAAGAALVIVPVQLRQAIAGIDVVAGALVASEQWELAAR